MAEKPLRLELLFERHVVGIRPAERLINIPARHRRWKRNRAKEPQLSPTKNVISPCGLAHLSQASLCPKKVDCIHLFD